MNAPNDDLLRADLQVLRALPAPEPPRELVERVARRAHVELAHSLSKRSPLDWIALAWTRVGLPVALFVTVVGYLFCAFQAASALRR